MMIWYMIDIHIAIIKIGLLEKEKHINLISCGFSIKTWLSYIFILDHLFNSWEHPVALQICRSIYIDQSLDIVS